MDEENAMLNEISQILRGQTLYESPYIRASQVALVVKNPPSSAGDKRDEGLIPGSERSPGEGYRTHSSVLTWRFRWREELGGLWSIGSQRDTTEAT